MKVLAEFLAHLFFLLCQVQFQLKLNSGEENEMLIPKNVIVATGSRPSTLPGLRN